MPDNMTDALKILYALVRLGAIGPTTVAMYVFMCVNEGMPISNGDLADMAGATVNTLKRHIRLLEHLSLIKVERKENAPNVYYRRSTYKLERGYQLLLTLVPSRISLESIGDRLSRRVLELRRLYKIHNLSDMETPYDNDDDWNRIKEIMRKHFTLKEIERGNPTSSRMFTKIYSLVDSDIDLDAYAAWFKKVKYRTKRFNWNLFLHDSMIEEYRDNAMEAEEMLRTSSEKRQKKHIENAEKDKDFYDSIPRRKR